MQLADAAQSQPPAKPSLPTDAELRAQAAEGRAKQQSQQAAGSDAQQAQQASDRTATQPVAQVRSPTAEQRVVCMCFVTPDGCTTNIAFTKNRQRHRAI